jgi:hypothetical protein
MSPRDPLQDEEGSMINGIFSLLILAADFWAILNIVQSSESLGSKVLWTLLVLLLPILGVIVWYFAGPKANSA